MNRLIYGKMMWMGYCLSLIVPHEDWLILIESFTGLSVSVVPSFDETAILQIVDDNTVLVDGVDRRLFSTPQDLKAWLLLTVSDVMIMRGELTVIHAASFIHRNNATLLCGDAWSGKSTLAFHACHKGLKVLGDDQVFPDLVTGKVFAVPRPMKRRVVNENDLGQASKMAIHARLDEEKILIEPRQFYDLTSCEQGYPISKIIHIKRHKGSGVNYKKLDRFEALQKLFTQMRIYCQGQDRFQSMVTLANKLSQHPAYLISVGNFETDKALDVIKLLDDTML